MFLAGGSEICMQEKNIDLRINLFLYRSLVSMNWEIWLVASVYNMYWW